MVKIHTFSKKKSATFHKRAFQNKFKLKEAEEKKGAGSSTRAFAKGHTGASSESMLLVQKNPQQMKNVTLRVLLF